MAAIKKYNIDYHSKNIENIESKLASLSPSYKYPDRQNLGPGGVLPILPTQITDHITELQRQIRNEYLLAISRTSNQSYKNKLKKYCEESDFVWCFDEPVRMVEQKLLTNEHIEQINKSFPKEFHSGAAPIIIQPDGDIFSNETLKERIDKVVCSTRMIKIWEILKNISFIFDEFRYGCGLELISKESVELDYTHNNLSIFGGSASKKTDTKKLTQYETALNELAEEGYIKFSDQILSLQYQVDVRERHNFEPFDNTHENFLPLSVCHKFKSYSGCFACMIILTDSINYKIRTNSYGFKEIFIDI